MYEKIKMSYNEKRALFCSNHFHRWLEQTVRMYCKNPRLKIVESTTTATDGKVIFENFENETYLDETLSKRTTTICYVADALHENGHIEESVFEIIWAINSDKWDASYLTTKEKRIVQKEVSEFVKDLTAYERHALADINNIVEDAGMEYQQGKKYGVFVENAFRISNAVTMNARPSLNEMKDAPIYQILVEAILCYSILGHTKGTIENEEAKTLFENTLMPLCKKGKYTANCLDRFKVAKEIFCYLLPYLKELENETKKPYENKAKSQQSGEQSKQRSQGSDEQTQNQGKGQNQTQRTEPNMESQGENNIPLDDNKKGNRTSVDDFDDIVEELSDKNKEKIMDEIERGLESIEMTLQEERKERQKSMLDDMSFQAMSSKGNACIDGAINIKAYRFQEENKDFYLEVLEKYNHVILMFTSYFQQLMKPRRNRKIYSNTGNICPQKLARYQFDKNIYTETLKVNSLPPFSVLLYIDASGSMGTGTEDGRTRIEDAKIAAIIMNEVFTRLNIPFAVITHASKYPNMELVCFRNFDSPNCEKYRLGAIGVNQNCGGSRDGFAIRFATELVKKRSEDVVVLSICDGAPTDKGYKGVAAQDDTKTAVKELSLFAKKVVGISIGNDEMVDEAVRYIYPQNNISISDLSMLPTALLNAII